MKPDKKKAAAAATASLEGSTVHVTGPLSFATVPGLLPSSAKWLNGGRGEVSLDLGGVPWADSAGLALLLEWLAQARARDITLRFTGIDRQVAEIIRVNGLQELFGHASQS